MEAVFPHGPPPDLSGPPPGHPPGPPPGHPWPPAAYGGRAGGAGPFAFSHSVPFPYFSGSAPGASPGNPYCSAATFQAFPGSFAPGAPSYDPVAATDFPQAQGAPEPEDEKAAQRRQDSRWLQRFSLRTRTRSSRRPPGSSFPAFRATLDRTARLVRELQDCCDTLKHRLQAGDWDEQCGQALRLREQLKETIPEASVAAGRRRRRVRRIRARTLRLLQRRQAEESRSQREAEISAWRMKRIQEVEERKKEKELKLAADSVLCEVRRKQADLKRMQDILKALEKLRRLRKEAASRRGIDTERRFDGQFGTGLEELRSTMRRRTLLYSAEEKALMVMLEGEQEGERRRERDRRVKKEMERQVQRRRTADAMLFGEECQGDVGLQPFSRFYGQGGLSLQALFHIRTEWDVFLVSTDHPNSSAVPPDWICPEPPSDEVWASALQPAD